MLRNVRRNEIDELPLFVGDGGALGVVVTSIRRSSNARPQSVLEDNLYESRFQSHECPSLYEFA